MPVRDSVKALTASAIPIFVATVIVGTLVGRWRFNRTIWNYQERSGRLVPMQAEVAWVINGKEFIYWRGAMTRSIPHTPSG